MSTWELPLVIFTVFGQWAIGLAIMLTLVEYFSPATITEANLKQFRMGGMAVLPLVAVGLLFSIFHLGRPFAAYRALFNLGQSMLSLEIAFFLVVGVLALIYSYMWWKTPDKSSRKIVGAALSIVGLAAIVISSKVYALPARLAWDSLQTTAAFILTAVLLGAVSVALLLGKSEDETSLKAKKVFGWVILGAVIATVVVLALFAQTYGASAEQSAAVAATFASAIFVVRLVLGILIPVALAGLFVANGKSSSTIISVALFSVVIGELSGRILFYSSVMSQYPWF
ncbi:MAG TPA: dimethyl sulfoxide reductase anchor subunit [Peptococcaceae bacterium]|nr:dimethyl sulfoxide reductase anchor subunit [Peptococcaceae bacterium]